MSVSQMGDRLLSFGGYAFIPTCTLDMDYPLAMRHALVAIPGSDFLFNPLGATPPPIETTDVTFTYWLDTKTNGSDITTNDELKAELALLKDALMSVGNAPLITLERDGTTTYSVTSVFKSMEPKIIGENLISVPLTLVFSPIDQASTITAAPMIFTIAGDGSMGILNPVGSPLSDARLLLPINDSANNIACGPSSFLYIPLRVTGSPGSTIWRIDTATRQAVHVAGTLTGAGSSTANGTAAADLDLNYVPPITQQVTVTSDPVLGDLYVFDAPDVIYKIDNSTHLATRYMGAPNRGTVIQSDPAGDGGLATAATIRGCYTWGGGGASGAQRMAVDGSGHLYVNEDEEVTIGLGPPQVVKDVRRIDHGTGIVTTVFLNANPLVSSGDQFICCDAATNDLYVKSDDLSVGPQVWKVPGGTGTPVLLCTLNGLSSPVGDFQIIGFFGGELYGAYFAYPKVAFPDAIAAITPTSLAGGTPSFRMVAGQHGKANYPNGTPSDGDYGAASESYVDALTGGAVDGLGNILLLEGQGRVRMISTLLQNWLPQPVILSPPSPAQFATVSPGPLVITWGAVPGAVSYQVAYDESGTYLPIPGATITTVSAPTTSATVTVSSSGLGLIIIMVRAIDGLGRVSAWGGGCGYDSYQLSS